VTPFPIRLLVTAVNGTLGQAVVKALRLQPEKYFLAGCDATDGIGRNFVDRFYMVPLAGDGKYLSALAKICREQSISAVVPASEAEISVLSAVRAIASNIPVVCQPAEWIETFGDKLNCMNALSGKLPLPRFADARDESGVQTLAERCGFPLVHKPRRGSGSRDLHHIRNFDELRAHLKRSTSSIVQEYVCDSGGEFSAGIFATESATSVIVFRRRLDGVGCSWFAETVEDDEIRQHCLRFAQVSKLRGAANLQFRKNERGVSLLEVNTRFSSLAAARALAGFADVDWSVLQALGTPLPQLPVSFRHVRFQRFFGELTDTGDGYRPVPEWQPR
jgi:carbamoyl-phosphate synthase large subunit